MVEVVAHNLREGIEYSEENFFYLRKLSMDMEPGTRLILPGGTYHVTNVMAGKLYSELMNGGISPYDTQIWRKEKNICLKLYQKKNIEIDGQGSLLIFDGLIQPIALGLCENVRLINFSIDWQRPLFSTGIIKKVENEKIYIDIDAKHSLIGGEPIVSYQDYDENNDRPGGICEFENISNLEKISGNLFCFSCKDGKKPPCKSRLIIRHIYSYAPAIHLFKSQNIFIENLSIHSAPGMGIIGHNCENISLSYLSVIPSGNRLMSTNCDATHFISNRGTINFNNCTFEAMGDDATNVHGFYFLIEEVQDSNSLKLCAGAMTQDMLPDIPSNGDVMSFVKRKTLQPYAANQIKEVLWDGESYSFSVKFEHPLPEDFEISDVVSNRSNNASLVFENCTVKNIRGRAVLIQSSNSLIKNCRFEQCTGQGVHVDTADGWWESSATENIEIIDNEFLNCGYGQTKYCDAVGVVVETEAEEPISGIHRNIRISGNIIKGSKTGILLRCAENVTIFNNTYEGCSPHIYLEHVKNVNI